MSNKQQPSGAPCPGQYEPGSLQFKVAMKMLLNEKLQREAQRPRVVLANEDGTTEELKIELRTR